MGEGPGEGLAYRRDVDGLRAVAILIVVAFHVGLPGFSGGFVGVDVFFVISGFLITSLLAREAAARGTIRLAEFYARRVRRLLPALATFLVGTLALGATLLSPLGDQQALAGSALATAAFVSNVYFWQASGDYFAGQTEQMPLLHTWSLAVEEQYYLAWPLLLLAAAWLSRRRGRPFEPLARGVLSVVFVLSLVACVVVTGREPQAAFYLTPFRAWEFAVGGLLALSGFTPGSRNLAAALGAGGLLAIGSATALFGPQTAFPGAAALLPVLGAAAVIAAGGGARAAGVTSMLASRPCVHLGQLSYSWYLWHWPLLAIARGEASAERSFLRDGALATVALLLAELTYRFVENPIRFGRPGPFRVTSRTLWSGLALSLLMAASAGLLRFIADARERDAASAMGPGLARGDLSPMNPGCNGFVDRATCTRGDFGRVPGIVVWGDSHAARMVSLAVAFGAESGLPVLQRSFNACPPLRNVLPTQVEGRANVACGGFNRSVEAEIAELARAGQVRGVILEARWPNYLAPGQGRGGLPRRLVVGRRVLDRIGSLRALKDGLGQRLDVLHELGVRVLLMAPLPEYPWRVPQCVLARGVKPCRISRARAEDDRRAAVEALREVAAGRPDVRLFDGIDAFCGTEWCDPAPGGEVALADEHHLTFRAAAGLLPRARADLRWLAGG